MKIKFKIYRYVVRLMLISTLISASVTYTVAQFYTEQDLRDLVKRAGKRTRTSRRYELTPCHE